MITIRNVFGAVAGLTAMVWGDLHVTTQVLLLLVALDIVTGIVAAGTRGELSSRTGYLGVRRKAMMFLLVGAATAIAPLMEGVPVAPAIAAFFSYVELLSVIENAVAVGLPVPVTLRDALKRFDVEVVPAAPPAAPVPPAQEAD